MDESPQSGDAGARQAAAACLDGLQPTAVEQQAALQRVLELSEQALRPGASPEPAPGSPSSTAAAAAADGERRLWWLCARLRALQHLERLATSLELHGGAWTPRAFAALRDRTAAQAASSLAAAGQLAALLLLLERHPRALAPALLDVLDCIPETATAKQLAPLLRQVLALRQPPPLPHPADWAESAATAAALKEAGEYALLLATEPMAEASSGWRPPTQRQVAAWVCQRAQRIDAATGLLPNAIALLEAAQSALHYSEPSVGALLASAQELLSLVKLAAVRDEGGAWRMDLQQYAALAPDQRLSLLLGQLGGDSLAADLAQHVAPFLSRLGSSQLEAELDPQLVLRQALEAEAARRLPWVVRLVQAEARQRSLFASAAQLARTAAACCYATEATDAWELLGSMLNAARDALRADSQLGHEEREAAEAAVDTVRGQMTAARLLTKHGLTTTIRAVRDADRSAALRLLRTLLARVARTKNTESRWVEVWMDLRSIQEHGLTQLSEDDVRTELCRALLRVGQYRLCKSYLAGLRPGAAEQLVLAAAREVFLSASGMSDRAVKQAKECLGLLPDSLVAQDQLASIRASEQLQRVGLDLPPLQLQQLQARAAAGDGCVLEQLLEEHPQLAAADSSTLGQLAAALGIAEQQQPLLLRAAEAAHAAGDVQRTQSLLLMLAGQHYNPAWELAAAVAVQPACSGSARQQLLVFALSAAPADELLPLLVRRKKVETAPAGMGQYDSAVDAATVSASSGSSGSAWKQLNAAAAGEKLAQALQLACKVGVPAWEVQLAFAESLLLHNQQHWQPGAAAPQLLDSALPPLLGSHQQAAALLCTLLLTVWPATSSRQGQHLRCVLHAIQRCCAAVVAGETSGSPASQHLPALAAACQAAEQLMQVAGGLDARLFLQPVVQLVAAQLGAAAPDASQPPAAAGEAPELNRQLFLHVTGSHAAQLAAAIAQLAQQYAAAAAVAGAAGSYPCSGSTVFLSLFCKSVARQLPKGGLSTAALQRCQVCLRHMMPGDAAAAVAFAAAGGTCPLTLPEGEQPLAAPSLPPAQQQQLLAAALEAVQRSQAAADASLQPVLQQLRRRHALLSACSSLAAACPGGEAAPAADHQQQLSAGDAVQNLFGLLRSLHQQPEPAAPPIEAAADAQQAAAAAAAEASAAALDALRQQVWQQLQRKAAAYDGTGGAAETEAHLQVLELLGSVGTPSLWPGWKPPASVLSAAGGSAAAATAGSAHRQALLFTRAAAMLAIEWPDAVQRCRLSAADCADALAAEAALLRLVAAAERPEQLRLLLRLLGELHTGQPSSSRGGRRS
ncbi:MAG2-interacting 2 [Chlorella sorokiniana]|uniref:MAG2-interacting 2 n=1 Tax=Chlorella sorokiniana TaxID=3076 RepID=A0A2P6TQ94_CHLSO|nr:MAG2-interacting 2 [Chlorella sorokiniana]|eukprot:PRW56208.1 MAG2-interacting 2 [Chlorella sorokiniana]